MDRLPPPQPPTFPTTSSHPTPTLEAYKHETMRICRLKGWGDVSTELLFMMLVEELGELASAIRRMTNNFSDRKRSNVTSEWFDVLSYLFQLADRFGVNLDDAFEEYISHIKKRRAFGVNEVTAQ